MTTPTVTVGDVLRDAQPLADAAARERVRRLLDQAAVFSRACKVCGRPLWFVRTRAAKLIPYTDDAAPHWADCPGADELRRARPKQAPLPMRIVYDRDPVDR